MPTSVMNFAAKSALGDSDLAQKAADWVPNLPVNVSPTERWLSLVGGGLLTAYGLTRGGLTGMVLPLAGGMLLYRAATGHCHLYSAMNFSTAGQGEGNPPSTAVEAYRGVKVEESVTVNRPAGELFRFWRRFDQLPRFMSHLQEVRILDNKRSHWVAKAPLGMHVEWDAEIINERDGELIAWRSLPGADVDSAGSVHFTPAGNGQSTEVRVVLKYDPPGGRAGATVAWLLGRAPEQEVRDDLQRFKQMMESGQGASNTGWTPATTAVAGR